MYTYTYTTNYILYIGWSKVDALRVMNAVKHLDVMIEQPCVSYRECLDIRRVGPGLPMILDEVIDDIVDKFFTN